MTILDRESRSIEYKREASDLRKIAQTVVAFANGIGGDLIIGVEDKTRKVIGLPSHEIETLLERLPVSLADRIKPPLQPHIHTKTIDDKEVLIVQIFQGMQKPYYLEAEGLEKGVYIRVGPHTRRAEGSILEELLLQQRRMGYDEVTICSCKVEELNYTILPKSLQSEKMLFALDILNRDLHSAEICPTRGGILMLHPQPEKFVAEAEVIISRMRGVSGRETIETHTINGPIPHQAEACLELLLEWLGSEPKLEKGKYRPQRYKLPLVAIREALHNALFHRQYSIPGAVKIALYADRLEIFSPGNFAGPFVEEALGDGTSYIRNRIICMVARRLNLIEKRGTGIAAIKNVLEEHGLPNAQFIEGANWFKVIFSFSTSREKVGKTIEDQIVTLFDTKAKISSSDVQKSLGVSKATAAGYLNQLIILKRIKRIGAGPSTHYELVESAG